MSGHSLWFQPGLESSLVPKKKFFLLEFLQHLLFFLLVLKALPLKWSFNVKLLLQSTHWRNMVDLLFFFEGNHFINASICSNDHPWDGSVQSCRLRVPPTPHSRALQSP